MCTPAPGGSVRRHAVARCADRADRDPEFARWLERDYQPVAGGWRY